MPRVTKKALRAAGMEVRQFADEDRETAGVIAEKLAPAVSLAPHGTVGGHPGRPRKVIDKSKFEYLCAIGALKYEICGVLGVTDKTLDRIVAELYKDENGKGRSFSDVHRELASYGNMAVKRALLLNAVANKNVTAQIFWMKNNYGWSDMPRQPDLDPALGGATTEFEIVRRMVEGSHCAESASSGTGA